MKAEGYTVQDTESRGTTDSVSVFARDAVLKKLGTLTTGRLRIVDQGEVMSFGEADTDQPTVTVQVFHSAFYRALAFRGSIGAGESYMRGEWACDDLTELFRLIIRNRERLNGMDIGIGRLSAPLQRLAQAFRANTRTGSRKNIAEHYDLGNPFFELFLDPTMMYSSAIFESPGMSLDDASVHKLDVICRKLRLKPGDTVLEIGTGWGGFAVHAAKHYGCRVVTTTISEAQFTYARERVQQAGLGDRVDVLCKDYRDLEGHYDKLVSIEMIEAVGHQGQSEFFKRCASLLKPEGLMLLQAITMSDPYYAEAKRSVDFIQRYIFPGGALPSVGSIAAHVSELTDFRIFDLQDIGTHYATTLKHWRERFSRKIAQVTALGYPDTFIRMWEYYLCYCEGGFREQSISAVQVLLAKPDSRHAPL